MIDARKGVLPQTCRHALVVYYFGIRHIVLAVNKCDLIGYDEATFRRIVDEFNAFATTIGFQTIIGIPVSARAGDNVVHRSPRTPWYQGPTLLEHIERLDIETAKKSRSFRMPVQWVCRPDANFRGFAGTVTSGTIAVGERIQIAGSARSTTVSRIVAMDGDRPSAAAGDAVMLALADEVDISRGAVLHATGAAPSFADQFTAHLLWLGDNEMLPGRSYLLKIGTQTVPATVTALKHRIDVTTGMHSAAKTLAPNEIALCNLSTTLRIAIDPFSEHPDTGCFILIDRFTNATVGAGIVSFVLYRADNIHPHIHSVSKAARAAANGQRPALVWFTGLSGAGKSTIANLVERKLHAGGYHTYLLDGDNVRMGLNRDLGFTDADRVENVRRVAEVARLFLDAGMIVLVSLISPFRSERLLARERAESGEFFEVFVDAPVEVCRQRDPKGLYAKAAAGLIPHFTGVSSPYRVAGKS